MPALQGLGRALRWIRDNQGKKQYQVAAAAGVTKAMLSAYETGKQKPSLDTLEKILDALAIDLSGLFDALEVVNGRTATHRHFGPDPLALPEGREAPGDWAGLRPPSVDVYRVLGVEKPLPAAEEEALSEMLRGFHKLIRYLHTTAESAARLREAPRKPDEPE